MAREPGPVSRTLVALCPAAGTFNYGEQLIANADGSVTYREADGSEHLFTPNGTGFTAPPGKHVIQPRRRRRTWVAAKLNFKDGLQFTFDAAGNLIAQTDLNNNNDACADERTGHIRDLMRDGPHALQVLPVPRMSLRGNAIVKSIVAVALVSLVLQLLYDLQYGWWLIGVLLLIAVLLSIPWQVAATTGEYRVAVITPFSRRLLKWYLTGRRTDDGRRIGVETFSSVDSFVSAKGPWDAAVVYQDFVWHLKRLRGFPGVVAMIQRRGERARVIDANVPTITSPPQLLKLLPVAPYSRHPGSTRVAIILVAVVALLLVLLSSWS